MTRFGKNALNWGSRRRFTPDRLADFHDSQSPISATTILATLQRVRWQCARLCSWGVTRRLPSLKFGFLEGGCGWSSQLLLDLIGHWEKRNLSGLAEVNPKNIDTGLLQELAKKYGAPGFSEAVSVPDAIFAVGIEALSSMVPNGQDQLDDFAACGVRKADDIKRMFTTNFYFGCEADDPSNVLAFNRKMKNPSGIPLRALFGSDFGHFDVPDMASVLPEAYEMVEHELITEEDFRDFMFNNPVQFYCEANPGFFKGTAVASDGCVAQS
jgi:hypothetical protein